MIEALVALFLTAVAIGALTAAGTVAGRSLTLVRDTDNALALAGERLEALRSGPRLDGADAPVGRDGTRFTRIWTVAGGRGQPAALDVQLVWGAHTLAVETEVLP